jgi:site-specific DNA-methyltransferase (adenine-specific)
MENTLYYGDNLEILRRYIPDESVDLVYLDPPFKSSQNYNILFKEKNGSDSVAQIKVFEDTWHWDKKAEETYIDITEKAPRKVADLIITLRSFLGSNDMMAYLVMMAIRLVELRRVLKDTGSIYLHCDPTASHYLKLVLDAVFGMSNFRNEIVWRYRRWPAKQKHFQRMHDIIFRYTKSKDWQWNQLYEELSESSRKQWKGKLRVDIKDQRGKRHSEILEKESPGVPMSDVWEISQLTAPWKEYLGYPTQKPEALLERIIKASSKEGDIVLDPFCGCGTTISIAEKFKRKWIGIDITHLAISLMRHRLKDTFGDQVQFKVVGEPVDLKGAEELAKQDPYQFQWWALGLVGARPAENEQKKGRDTGIDGYIYFHDEPQNKQPKTKRIIIQIKSGNVNPGQIRDLKGVVEREKAQIGVFITLQEPTSGMKTEAVSSGFYWSPGWNKNYPKVQILTIKEFLEGKGIDYPPKTSITFKKAEKHKFEIGQQLIIPDKEKMS